MYHYICLEKPCGVQTAIPIQGTDLLPFRSDGCVLLASCNST